MGRAERAGVDVSALSALAGQARPVTLAEARTLPVLPTLETLFPDAGLRRGTTLVVKGGAGSGATSLVLGLLAAVSSAGSWCAMVTVADLGLVAAAEAGLDLRRLALIPDVSPGQWTQVVGALIDAVDVVVASPFPRLRIGDARRLSNRARERGTVLVVFPAATRADHAWADGPDLRLSVQTVRWHGQGLGWGQLQRREVDVVATGRGAAARPRHVRFWLPVQEADGEAGMEEAGAESEIAG